MFSPALKWFNNTIEQPNADKLKNKKMMNVNMIYILEASLSPAKKVATVPTKSIINRIDIFMIIELLS